MSRKQNIIIVVSIIFTLLVLLYSSITINDLQSRRTMTNTMNEIEKAENILISDETYRTVLKTTANEVNFSHNSILLNGTIFIILYIIGIILYLKKEKQALIILTSISIIVTLLLLITSFGVINLLSFGIPAICFLLFIYGIKTESKEKKKF